jgi:DNA-binding response OmpR family regulator
LKGSAFPARNSCTRELGCLIVEDDVLIALSIEAYLEEAGYEVAGLMTSVAETVAWLEGHRPGVVILDYSLKDGACTELARHLRDRRIPFMIYSGHRREGGPVPEFAAAPWVVKPSTRDDIISALRSLMSLPVGA